MPSIGVSLIEEEEGLFCTFEVNVEKAKDEEEVKTLVVKATSLVRNALLENEDSKDVYILDTANGIDVEWHQVSCVASVRVKVVVLEIVSKQGPPGAFFESDTKGMSSQLQEKVLEGCNAYLQNASRDE